MMTDCIFCKIADKQIPASVVYEDDEMLCFKDIRPAAPVHLLLIPKEHFDSLAHAGPQHEALLGKMMLKVPQLAAEHGLHNGFKTQINTGSGGGQDVAGIGSSVLKTVIDGQCRTELNNRNEWRMIALSMSAERQRQWEDRICSCVSEDALNQVSVADLTSMLDTNSRNQAVAKITARTVTSCVKRIYRP